MFENKNNSSIFSPYWTRIFAYAIIAVSFIVYLGWFTGWMLLTSILPNEVPMALSTATCFVLFGTSLLHYIRFRNSKSESLFVRLPIFLIFCLTAGILFPRILGSDMRWEHFNIQIQENNFQFVVGHMSYVTMALFILAGTSMLLQLSKSKFHKKVSSFISVSSLIFTVLILLGYLLKTPFFYHGTMIPPASLSALAFLFGFSGLITASDSDSYIVTKLTGKSTRERLIVFAIPFTVALALIEGVLIVQILPYYDLNPAIVVSVITFGSIVTISLLVPLAAKLLGDSLDSAIADLSESEEKFRNLFENSPIGKSMTRIDGMLHVNKEFCRIVGYSADELQTKSWMDITYPDDIAPTNENLQLLLDAKSSLVRFEKRMVHKKGYIIWADLSTYLQRDKMGNPLYYITSVSDITERKAAIESIKKQADLLEMAHDSILVRDKDSKIIYWNQGAEKCYGWSKQEALGKSSHELLMTQFPVGIDEIENELKKEGHWEGELIHTKKDGTEVIVSSRWQIQKVDGDPEYFEINSDITKSKLIENEIIAAKDKAEESARQLKYSQRVARIGYYLFDIQRDCWTSSEMLDEILGIDKEYIRDVNGWLELISPGMRSDMQNYLATNILTNHESFDKQYKVLNYRTNTECWVHGLGTLELDSNGALLKMFGTIQDISQVKNSEQELTVARERAEESDRLKSALLNNMSHEIRTPMNAIMGFSSLLSGANGDEIKAFTDIIVKSSEHLLKLLDDVILLSRLQSEKMREQILDCIPAEIINYIFSIFQHSDLNKGLEIRSFIPDEYKNLIVRADESKIRQVLTNLVSNAVKYTPKGFIEIGFCIVDQSLEFYVKDTGIGVPLKEQKKIFETFFRGEAAISNAIRGNGLGLNIAKELVEVMHGTIGVISEPMKGSHFYFTIPLVTATQIEIPKMQPLVSHKATDLSILVADDEPLNFQYIEILLKGIAKRLDHASNGKIAVEMALKQEYDLVLMDIKMPIMDGIEATKIILESKPDLPVIGQTAFNSGEDLELARKAGFVDFVIKPISKASLLKTISKIFS